MRLLVCGGAGFIGSDFVRRMLAKHDDWEIRVLDKLTYAGNLDNLAPVAENPRYSFVRADICDREAVEAAAEGVDAIVNFA
ncbi:MAG: NAD-dependent epimerase/dehydratase family protein, partial [Actinobacteria bacterium]